MDQPARLIDILLYVEQQLHPREGDGDNGGSD